VARLAAPRPPPARGRQPPEGALDAPHVPALGGGVPGRMSRRLLLVLVLAAGVFVWRLGRPGFSDTEGMFAEPAREMVETGDWVTPRMNGEPFLTKPPLAYWLAATVMAVRGPTEYARLVPALAALGTVAVTGALGTVLFGEAAGLAAAVVLVTSAGFLVEARLLRADMLLVLAITTALWAAASVRRRPSLGMAMLFWVALGLGTLDKGLVALVIPVAALALAVVVEGGAAVRALVARLRAPLGLAVLAAIVVPWPSSWAVSSPTSPPVGAGWAAAGSRCRPGWRAPSRQRSHFAIRMRRSWRSTRRSRVTAWSRSYARRQRPRRSVSGRSRCCWHAEAPGRRSSPRRPPPSWSSASRRSRTSAWSRSSPGVRSPAPFAAAGRATRPSSSAPRTSTSSAGASTTTRVPRSRSSRRPAGRRR